MNVNMILILVQIKIKKYFLPLKRTIEKLLEKLAFEGMYYRFGRNNKAAEDRVIKELEIINDLGFNAYFLITWDIVRYAQSRGFFYVGRGSGGKFYSSLLSADYRCKSH